MFAPVTCNGQMVIVDREYDDTEEQKGINRIVYAILGTTILFAVIVGAIIIYSSHARLRPYHNDVEEIVIDGYGTGVANTNNDTEYYGKLEDKDGAYYGDDVYTINLVSFDLTVQRPAGMQLSTKWEDPEYPYISFYANNYKITCDYRESDYASLEAILKWYDAEELTHGDIAGKEYVIWVNHYEDTTSYHIYQDIGAIKLVEIDLNCHNVIVDDDYVKSLLIQEQYFITE